jgi:hypothetical protein
VTASGSPEFSLLVSCCRWNFANADQGQGPEIPSGVDWAGFVGLARFHRVQGLAWNALAQLADGAPEDARQLLSSDAKAIAATNMAIARECSQLRDDFDRAGTALLFVKGLTVGALAYRSPLLKMGWDIDLLIDPRDLDSAADALVTRGYSLRLPAQRAQLRSWHERSKESVWHQEGSLFVELHTGLADNRQLIPTLDVHSPTQMVEAAPGMALPTLAEDELFAYLAVHGASSAWFRLKWISDFAALIHGRRPEEIERLYRRSQELGAGRAAGQALLLADCLFDALQPVPELRTRLGSDRPTRMLCNAALRMVAEGERDPTEKLLGTSAIHWTQFLLMPGLGYKLSELRRQAGLLMRRLH